MKRIISLLILISLLALGTVSADPGSPWSKYVTADKSLSFHYPSGWSVSTDGSMVAVENSATEEELVMTMIPFDQLKSPQDLANGFIAMLKNSSPNFRAFNWRSQTESASLVVFIPCPGLRLLPGPRCQYTAGIYRLAELWFRFTTPEH